MLCLVCDSHFQPKSPKAKGNSKYCSHSCRLIARRKRWKAQHTTATYKVTCDNCKKRFIASNITTIHCSDECKREAARLKAVLTYQRKTYSEVKCPTCSSFFKPKKSTSQFCSTKCGQRAKYLKSKGLTEADYTKPCVHCNTVFTAVYANRHLYCSKKCKNQFFAQRNPQYFAQKFKEYYENNKEYLSKASARWAKKNPGANAFLSSKRKKAVKRATPAWADLTAIRFFYENTPEGMEVDHEVPIQGKTVCGLHILSNLQYLTRSQNASKSNKLKG